MKLSYLLKQEKEQLDGKDLKKKKLKWSRAAQSLYAKEIDRTCHCGNGKYGHHSYLVVALCPTVEQQEKKIHGNW